VAVPAATGFAALAVLAAFWDRILLKLDLPVQRVVEGHRVEWVTDVMKVVTWLGSSAVAWGVVGALALWALATGRLWTATVLVVAFALAFAVKFPLKTLVDRPRPHLSPLVQASGAAFPSGHALTALWLWGLLPLVLVVPRVRAWAWGAAAMIVPAVGFSRIYLGEHWLTDVIGSLLLGAVALAITAAALRLRPVERPPPP
jgi:membrane-associated phospholipid phosphatase